MISYDREKANDEKKQTWLVVGIIFISVTDELNSALLQIQTTIISSKDRIINNIATIIPSNFANSCIIKKKL